MSFFSALGYALGTLGQILPGSPVWRQISQQANIVVPNETRDVQTLAVMRRRGVITDDIFYDELLRQGFDKLRADQLLHITDQLIQGNDLVNLFLKEELEEPEFLSRADQIGWSPTDIKRMLQVAKLRLDPNVVITAWRRGLFKEGGDNDLFDDLRHQGYTDDRIETLKKVFEFFPAPNDLVRFAVREVYTPEIRERFQLDEDLPPEFISESYKAGLPEDQAKNYWASHWELPSIQLGFEMLHRRVIGKEDLSLLMRSLDVMPFWRDKLIDISFSPFTRVDIRRMHKVGVLDEAGVLESYQDIGYSEEKSRQLTDFTIRINEDSPEQEKTSEDKRKEELKGLTRSNIVSAYKDNFITVEQAVSFLQDIKLTKEVAEFFIGEVDFEKEKDRIADEIKNIEDEYMAGGINFNEAVERLTNLELLSKQTEELVDRWELKKKSKSQRPSKADLEKFVSGNVLSLEQYKSEMSNLGYPAKYISMYTQLLKAKK